MAFASAMVDELRLLLGETADEQVPYATKKLYLNNGIDRMWPRVYRIAEVTITLAQDTYEYSLPAATYLDMPVILSVQYSSDGTVGNYARFSDYDTFPGNEDVDGYLRVTANPPTGAKLRIRYAVPIAKIVASTYAAAQSEAFVGTDAAMRLPVLYAMGMIAAGKIDNRQDHTRYSTTQAANAVQDSDIMQFSQMWFSQYDVELADMERPLPISRD